MSLIFGVTFFQGSTAAAVIMFILAYAIWSPWAKTITGKALMALAATALVLLLNGISHTIWGDYPGMNWVRLGCYVSLTAVWTTLLLQLIRAQLEYGRRPPGKDDSDVQ